MRTIKKSFRIPARAAALAAAAVICGSIIPESAGLITAYADESSDSAPKAAQSAQIGVSEEGTAIYKSPDRSSEEIALIPQGGAIYVSSQVKGHDDEKWLRVQFVMPYDSFQTNFFDTSDQETGYVPYDALVTGEDALQAAIDSGYLFAGTSVEIPLYILPDHMAVMDQMNPWDVLRVSGVDGTRLELLAYDETPVYVESSMVSLCTDKVRREAQDEIKAKREAQGYTAPQPSSPRTAFSNTLIATAKQYLGCPYVFGGENLATGTDCSAYVQKIYALCGISIPRTVAEQYNACAHVGREAILPGDLVFYHGYYNGVPTAGVGHVAIYIGDGLIIHSRNVQRGVCIDPIDTLPMIAVGRFY